MASTPQQKIGLLVVLLLVIGWLAYIVVHVSAGPDAPPPGSEIELAPNRKPYLDDDALEGRKLEKALGWALVLLIITAIGLPLYWAGEPGRQKQHLVGLRQEGGQPRLHPVPGGRLSRSRPGNVGHFGCAPCHGASGEGGAANYASPTRSTLVGQRQVQWKAPALNTVMLRYTDDTGPHHPDLRPANTPMPAWGVLGGGPMNDQQIDDLVALPPSKLALTPRSSRTGQKAAAQYGETDGAKLFDGFCARCHTKGWSYGEPDVTGGGAFGPNLTNGDTIRQFPDVGPTTIDFITDGASTPRPRLAAQGPTAGPAGSRGGDGQRAAACRSSARCSRPSRSRPSSTTSGACDARADAGRPALGPADPRRPIIVIAVLAPARQRVPPAGHQHRGPASGSCSPSPASSAG